MKYQLLSLYLDQYVGVGLQVDIATQHINVFLEGQKCNKNVSKDVCTRRLGHQYCMFDIHK